MAAKRSKKKKKAGTGVKKKNKDLFETPVVKQTNW